MLSPPAFLFFLDFSKIDCDELAHFLGELIIVFLVWFIGKKDTFIITVTLILLDTKFWLRNFPCDRIFLCSLGTDNLLHAITNTYDWAALAFQKKLKLSCLRLANRRKSQKQAIAASFFFAFFNNANLPQSSSELKYKFIVSSGSISSLQQ